MLSTGSRGSIASFTDLAPRRAASGVSPITRAYDSPV